MHICTCKTFVPAEFKSISRLQARILCMSQVCAECGSLTGDVAVQLLLAGWTVAEKKASKGRVFYLSPPGYSEDLAKFIRAIDATTRGKDEQLPSNTQLPMDPPRPLPYVSVDHFSEDAYKDLLETVHLLGSS